jgi:hypothetical protein
MALPELAISETESSTPSADGRLPEGTRLPNGKLLVRSDSLPHRMPGAPQLVVDPKTGRVTAIDPDKK